MYDVKKILDGYDRKGIRIKFPGGKQNTVRPEHSSVILFPQCGSTEIEVLGVPSKNTRPTPSLEEVYEVETPTATADREAAQETGVICKQKRLIASFPRRDMIIPGLQHQLYGYIATEYDASNMRRRSSDDGAHPPLWIPLTLAPMYFVESHMQILGVALETQRDIFEKMIHRIVELNQKNLDHSKRLMELYYNLPM